MGAKREFEEQAQRARENSKERQAAHRRAIPIERAMNSNLRAARQPRTRCEVEYAPIKPRQGIVPIACGNLRAQWPLVVNHGYLRCEPSIRKNFDRVIFTAPSGTEYAVNSSAYGVGYEGIDGIWKRNGQGEKIDIGPLLARGLALCRTERPVTG